MADGFLLWPWLVKLYHALPLQPSIPSMTDTLGFRKKFAVIAPSTNTSVRPEFDRMAPRGVTNHFGRISIPNDPVHNDDDFNQLMINIRTTMMETIDR
jgi:maleate isomerase